MLKKVGSSIKKTLISKDNSCLNIISIQLLIFFIVLNLSTAVFYNFYIKKHDVSKIISIDNTYLVSLAKDDNSLESYADKLEKLIKEKEVESYGKYYIDKVELNDESYKGIFCDESCYLMNNSLNDKGKEIFETGDKLRVMVSNDLKDKFSIGDNIKININSNKIDAVVWGYISDKSKFFNNDINKNSKLLGDVRNSIIIPFSKNGLFYDKNIDYNMYSNIIVATNNDEYTSFLQEKLDEKVINKYKVLKESLSFRNYEFKELFIKYISLLIVIGSFSIITYILGRFKTSKINFFVRLLSIFSISLIGSIYLISNYNILSFTWKVLIITIPDLIFIGLMYLLKFKYKD